MSRFLTDHDRSQRGHPRLRAASLLTLVGLLVGILGTTGAMAATLTISVNGDGTSVTEFRWLVEEDATRNIVPGETCKDATKLADCLSVQFHQSYMPAVAKGHSDGVSGNTVELEAGKRYFVSVLPDAGYTLGGASVAVGDAGATVEVLVHPYPVETAQIRVFAFLDNAPINGSPDAAEIGLGPWAILVEDGGGRYGIAAGQMVNDVFGNPLGTSYAVDNMADPGDCVTGSPGTSDCVVVDATGTGSPMTGPTGDPDAGGGVAAIKNLQAGKFGIQVVPPATGECPPGWLGSGDWQQTSTIEGTHIDDAWVKHGEPPYFAEFGPPGPHVFIGFIQDCYDPSALSGGATITGTIRSIHNNRPPDFGFHPGMPVPGCWVGLNSGAAGTGTAIFAGPCDDESNFSIPDVPGGTYNLTVWDTNLDYIIANQQVEITATDATAGTKDLGDVSVFAWFQRMEHWVFYDEDQDGFRDPGEIGIPEQAINLRWRDGSVYQSFPTDRTGYVPFDEVFPFFTWLIAEVDYLRFRSTGATMIVDAGGPVDPDGPNPPTSLADWDCPDPTSGVDNPGGCPIGRGQLNPQPQFCTAEDIANAVIADPRPDPPLLCLTTNDPLINPNTLNQYSRTVVGDAPFDILLQGFQGFLGQTNIIEWGKAPYARGENGGIAGIVFNTVTRAEDDPRYAAAEPWEPGIPRIQVALYQDANRDGQIDDLDGDGCPTPADVDNHPFGNFPGAEDFKYVIDETAAEPCTFIEGTGDYHPGDAIQIVTTDSWDDNQPTGCQGEIFYVCPEGADPNCNTTGDVDGDGNPDPLDAPATDCYDGLRNFNQIRPAVFDGGYAIGSYVPGGLVTGAPEETLPAGTYIVEAGAHRVYAPIKEEDRNVDFGDEYVPDTMLLPPTCVGELHEVPAELTLFPGVPGYYGGQTRPLCNRKQVKLSSGMNAAADFHMLTEVPASSHVLGFILNDLANEFDPNAPTFGEKQAPPWMPISFRDWTGTEIAHTYSDRWGLFNALLPSTYTANVGVPSGMGPNMVTACMNSPFMKNPDWDGTMNTPEFIPDPFFQKQYSQWCYTLQFMPGVTTYLDTPVVPVAAFAGPGQFPLDCQLPNNTPGIATVNSGDPTIPGPYLTVSGSNYHGFLITSMGMAEVANPLFGQPDQPKLVTRDYRFPPSGPAMNPRTRIFLDDVDISSYRQLGGGLNPREAIRITAFPTTLLAGKTEAELRIVDSQTGAESVVGVTVHLAQPGDVIGDGGNIHQVLPGGSIQDAIDAASPGDLILVAPGVYEEMVLMWKPVRLQGWGAGSTYINAVNTPTQKLNDLRNKVESLLAQMPPAFDLLPAQEQGGAAFGGEPATLFTEEGAGILVVGKSSGPDRFRVNASRIDGLTITGSANGGGITANGYAQGLQISNNRLYGNWGVYGGGIRIGHPLLQESFVNGDGVADLRWQDAVNDDVAIHHNQVIENASGETAAGGGISLCHGADRYSVTENWICGNFTQGDGGGIGHLGRSQNGLIADNTIIFNQSFTQGLTVNGGGIYVDGAAPIGTNPLSEGSGTFTIDSNLILGNNAGGGNGGGIALVRVNGQDVEASPDSAGPWYVARIYNNFIADNVAGLAGGAISLQDVAEANIDMNTIANNDSTATAGEAFQTGSPNESTPQVAGIVSYGHSAALADAVGNATFNNVYRVGTCQNSLPLADRQCFSNPRLDSNIIRDNRSFHFTTERDPVTQNPINFGLVPDIGAGEPVVFDDLGVVGVADALLRPRDSVLRTELMGTYLPANTYSDADLFALPYFNGDRGQTINQLELTTIGAQPAFDEGGNFIDVRFGPLTLDDNNDGTPDANYHLSGCGTPADDTGREQLCNGGASAFYCVDFDDNGRNFVTPDAGADEVPGCVVAAVPFASRTDATLTTAGATGTTTDSGTGLEPATATITRDTRTGQTVGGTLQTDPNAGTTATLDPAQGADPNATLAPRAVAQAEHGPVACMQFQHFLDRYPSISGAVGQNGGPAKCMSLSAGDGYSKMADDMILYGFGFRDVTGLTGQDLFDDGYIGAEFSAPTIAVDEGDEFYLEVTNVGMPIRPDLFDPHTVHFHGHPNASAVFDGLPESGIAVNMNATLTYYYKLVHPGTYMYHCHVEATEHMQMGMLGNLYVRPKQNGTTYNFGGKDYSTFAYNDGDGSTGYDKEYPIQMWSFDSNFHLLHEAVQPLPFAYMTDDHAMLNGRGYPDTVKAYDLTNDNVPPDHLGGTKYSQRTPSLIEAAQGERVLLRFSNLNVTNFYTVRSLGIPMQVVGQDARLRRGPGPGGPTDGKDLYFGTTAVTLGGGESMDVILDTTGIAPGTYFLYTTNLNFLTNKDEDLGGMMTEIVITPAP